MFANQLSQAKPVEDIGLGILARVSHDLKNPMNAMIGSLDYIELLARETSIDRNEILEILAIARVAGDDMTQLIHSILTIARAEVGKESFAPERIDKLGQELQKIASTFKFEAILGKKRFEIDIAPDLPEVRWDFKKIHYHVLNNLISNALKFVPAHGRIVISAQTVSDEIVIRVADDGPGIPFEARSRVFDRFEREQIAVERAYQGFGLGLYTAQLFVKAHQGDIHIEDGLDGRGVSFVVRLPRFPIILAG